MFQKTNFDWSILECSNDVLRMMDKDLYTYISTKSSILVGTCSILMILIFFFYFLFLFIKKIYLFSQWWVWYPKNSILLLILTLFDKLIWFNIFKQPFNIHSSFLERKPTPFKWSFRVAHYQSLAFLLKKLIGAEFFYNFFFKCQHVIESKSCKHSTPSNHILTRVPVILAT